VKDGGITGVKLADGSVDSTKISDGSISLNDIASFGASMDQVISFNGSHWRPKSILSLSQGNDIKILSNKIHIDPVVDSSIYRINSPSGKNFVIQNSLGNYIVLDSMGNGKVFVGIVPPSPPPVKMLIYGDNSDDELALINNGNGPSSLSLGLTGNVINGSEIFSIKGGDFLGTGIPTTRISSKATQNWSGTGLGSSLIFSTTENDNVGLTDRMIIDQNGNVGIGITFSPTHLLHVGLSNTGAKNVRFQAYSGIGPRMLYVKDNGEVRDTVFPVSTSDSPLKQGYDIRVVGDRINLDQQIDSIETINVFGDELNINATGTQNVNFNIENGKVNITSSIPTNLAFQVTGRIKSNAITEVSDERLKKDIESLKDALYLVTQLRGVSYRWKKDTLNSAKEIGLIAQEVEKVIPELVDTDEKGYKSVQYSHLVAYLVEAIKEQQKIISQSQKQIEKLSNALGEVEKLREGLEALMQRVVELESIQYNEVKR
jgi:hypothetical protein